MILLESHIVSENVSDIRLSDYAGGIFTAIPSRKGMKKATDRGEIFVNGITATTATYIKTGDLIQIMDLQKKAPKPYELKIEVVYEDEYLAVVKKPAGLVTSGNQYKTLQNCLAFNLSPSLLPDSLPFFQPTHRLDAPTSGLVLVGKSAATRIHLGLQFENRTIKKKYQAIVIGKPSIGGFIGFDVDGKVAKTEFKTLKTVPSLRNGYISLVELSPATGRTHQLRKHLAAIGHPIFGDKLYGTKGQIYKGKGLFLAAIELDFEHNALQKKLTVSCETPHKFLSLLTREQRRAESFKQ